MKSMIINFQFPRNTNFAVCLLGILVSLSPHYYPIVVEPIDEETADQILSSLSFRDASLACLLIVLPSFIDVSFDIFLDLAETWSRSASSLDESSAVKQTLRSMSAPDRAVSHLSTLERLCFMVGVFCSSVIILVSTSDQPTAFHIALFYSMANLNTILCVCPLVLFLGRCTETWTELNTFFVVVFTNIGAGASSVSVFYEKGCARHNAAFLINAIFSILAAGMFTIVSLKGALKYSINAYRKDELSLRSHIIRTCQMLCESRSNPTFYQDYVTAIHTIILLVLVIVNIVWYTFPTNVTVNIYFTYLQAFLAAMVLVVEIRIRKNEVLYGLVSPTNKLDTNSG